MAGQSRFSMSATISLIDKMSGPMNTALKSVSMFSDKTNKHFGNATKSANTFNGSVGNIIKGVLGANLLIGGLRLIKDGFMKAVNGAAMFESSLANFTTLLGGNEQSAKRLVEQLQIMGAETPFEFQQLAKTVETLLPTMDGNIQKTIDTVRMLGDTAGGNADKLDRITRGFTKAMLKGKVDMESLNMIAEAGVPIHTELAKSMGYGKDQMTAFFKKVSTGTVSTEQLVKVFEQMTSKGGLFFGGMIRSSKTFNGVMSNMNDAMNLTFAGIGEAMLPTIKEIAVEITKGATSMLKWVQANKEFLAGTFNTIVSVIKGAVSVIWSLRYVIMALTVAYAIWKTLVMATNIAGFIQMLIAFRMEYVKLIASQWGLNAAMLANPLTWLILVFAAAAVWIVYLNSHISEMNKLFLELTSILDNPIIKQILGVVLGGGVTGFMMQVREKVSEGTQAQTASTRENQQQSNLSPNNRGVNSTTTNNNTTSGTIDLNANGFSSIVKQGTFPKGFTLNSGKDAVKL